MARPADDEYTPESTPGMSVWAEVNAEGVEAEITLHGQPFHPEVLDMLTTRVGEIISRQIAEARRHEAGDAAEEDEDLNGRWADILCHYEDTAERPHLPQAGAS